MHQMGEDHTLLALNVPINAAVLEKKQVKLGTVKMYYT